MKQASETRVFVVDDERLIADTLAAILVMAGFCSCAFVNPFDALKAADDAAPDWLISDVMMPRLSGVELAVRMKESCPGCRILLFSSVADTMDLLEEAHGHGHDFQLLTKPVHPSVLLKEIRTQMAGSG